MSNITLRHVFDGAGTSPYTESRGPALLCQGTGQVYRLYGSNMPEDGAAWVLLGSAADSTPVEVTSSFAYVRIVSDGSGTVVVSSASAPAAGAGGGGSGGAVTIADGADATLGAKADAAASTDTGTASIIALVKRSLSNWTALLARIPTLGLVRTNLLSAVTATGAGSAVADSGRAPSFTATVSGTGAVAATVLIQARNTASGQWITLGTITLSGTTTAVDGFASLVRYLEYRANLTAISGTSASVTVDMGS